VLESEHGFTSYLGDSTAHDRERSSETLACVADHKHKYDELLDRMERNAWLRAEAQRVSKIFGHEEPVMRRDQNRKELT
jgi:hypothetical protein